MSIFDASGWKSGVFSNQTYHYLSVKPASKDKKTFILFHGFPTGALSFRKIVPRIVDEGHGVILAEMLGYGGTSRPKEPEAYSRIAMADAVAEILAVEGVERGIVMGHDWGVTIATRFVLKYPQLCEGLILIGFTFIPPEADPQPMNVQGYNDMFKPLMGFEPLAFLRCMFNDSPRLASGLMFSDVGALEANVTADRKPPIAYWITGEEMRATVDFVKNQDMEALLNYYQFALFHFDKGDSDLPKRLKTPYLYFECQQDPTIAPPIVHAQIEDCDDITIKTLKGGHWVMEEEPDSIIAGIKEWLATRVA
ncbi:alpha/beta-hydrolase [Clavulina sp. PMI_390]|nr:alpha/beta-hydrolase [Clavulina sp. PMI_390]